MEILAFRNTEDIRVKEAYGDPMVTVRKGFKWAERSGEGVVLTDGEGVPFGKAYIHFTHICQFWEIPARHLEAEHDPECRSYSGLLKRMTQVYAGFSEDDWVCVVHFDVIEIFEKPKPKELEWTDTRPTADGYYWYREKKPDWASDKMKYFMPRVVQVVGLERALIAIHMEHRRFVDEMNGEWCGPLKAEG